MKRCPQCGNTYTDQSLYFCLQDGARLYPAESDAPPTEVMNQNRQSTITVHGPPPLPQRPQPQVSESRKSPPWLLLVSVVLLLSLLGGGLAFLIFSGWGSSSGPDVTETTPSPQVTEEPIDVEVTSASPTPESTPVPQIGTISGRMSYPSDGIPSSMVACAEEIETGKTVCSKPRSGWTSGVSYSLTVAPGRYYVYGRVSKNDTDAGGFAGQRAYYTEYMKCGMGANCQSHRRIVLEVKGGESLSGIAVGDWWANM